MPNEQPEEEINEAETLEGEERDEEDLRRRTRSVSVIETKLRKSYFLNLVSMGGREAIKIDEAFGNSHGK